ncbi:MAG: hypothetical protein ACOVP4_04915 [Bacteriovoracaceae bacterium]
MSRIANNSQNVYPKITLIRYIREVIIKYKGIVLGIGLLFGIFFWVTSYFQVFTSSSVLKFKSPESKNTTSSIDLINSNTQSMRDKFFLYLHSRPFAEILLNKVLLNENGEKILKIIDKSRNNFLVKLKGFFVSTYKYELDKKLKRTRALAGIVHFKKEGDDSILILVKTGIPELSKMIGEVVAPIIRGIILENEANEVNTSLAHLRHQFDSSEEKLKKIESDLVHYQKKGNGINGNILSTPNAVSEVEKELRASRIETQRLDMLVKNLEKQISENSIFKNQDGNYKYIDQASIERLDELKQQRDTAFAKLSSVESLYTKIKDEQLSLPESFQALSHLTSQQNLEKTVNNEIFFKIREAEEVQAQLDSSVRLIGATSIISATFKLSPFFHFVLGTLLGMIGAILGLYYYFDFFKVIKGNHDLRNSIDSEILHPVPMLKGQSKLFDVWRDLPLNHHALEAFGQIMDKCESSKVISFISADRNDGKSFIVANLAQNFSRFGKKVLIIDTNWENPTLTNKLEESPSLKIVKADQFKHDKESFLDRTLLISQIKLHAKEYDIIIIDTKNLYQSNDALIVASVSNLNILVCSHLETFQHRFDTAIDKLKAADINNYCVLLNKANIQNEILPFKGRVNALDYLENTSALYLKKSS